MNIVSFQDCHFSKNVCNRISFADDLVSCTNIFFIKNAALKNNYQLLMCKEKELSSYKRCIRCSVLLSLLLNAPWFISNFTYRMHHMSDRGSNPYRLLKPLTTRLLKLQLICTRTPKTSLILNFCCFSTIFQRSQCNSSSFILYNSIAKKATYFFSKQ